MTKVVGRAPRDLALVLAILAAFLIIGMPDGMTGAVWPHMRPSLGAPLGALSLLIAGSAAGFFMGTLSAGPAVRRLGARPLVCVALIVAAGSSASIASSSILALTVGSAFLMGACGGLIDAVVSTIVALSGNTRLMGFMHGTLSAGAALSPIVVAAVTSTSWRGAYLAIGMAQVTSLGLWVVATRPGRTESGISRALANLPSVQQPVTQEARAPRPMSRRVLVGLAAFLSVSGLGMAAGSWGGVYLTGVQELSTTAVGVTLSLYWACLSLSRFAVGLVNRVSPAIWLTGGGILAMTGAALTLLDQPVVAAAGLVMIGAGVGPLFPVLSSQTPARVGREHSGYVIGWQLAAASVGAALMPGLLGVAVSFGGATTIGPGFLACSVLCLALSSAAHRTHVEPRGLPGVER